MNLLRILQIIQTYCGSGRNLMQELEVTGIVSRHGFLSEFWLTIQRE